MLSELHKLSKLIWQKINWQAGFWPYNTGCPWFNCQSMSTRMDRL